MKKLVRTVCFVAGAGTALPSSVGRLLGTAPPPDNRDYNIGFRPVFVP